MPRQWVSVVWTVLDFNTKLDVVMGALLSHGCSHSKGIV